MAIEAVKIPQNVYVEDRIIGPITLRQLLITGLGAGISYAIFAIATKAGAGLPILVACWMPAVIAAGFSFLKINDLSLFRIILLVIEEMNKPSQRYWSPHQGLSINLITRQATKEIADADSKIADNASRLAEVTRQLEKRQEEMNRLASHDTQTPQALEPIKTKLEHATDTIVGPVAAATPEKTVLPVNTNRVQSDGLDPERSIDGIANAISAYDRLVTKPA